MRTVACLWLVCLLPGGAMAGPELEAYPVSSKPVLFPRLVKTMPGHLVVQAYRDQLLYALGRDGGKRWDELWLDAPDGSGGAFNCSGVGEALGSLVLGSEMHGQGVLEPYSMPVWHGGMAWTEARLTRPPERGQRGLSVSSLAYGDKMGMRLYAFGGVKGDRGARPCIWRSDDCGVRWETILADHEELGNAVAHVVTPEYIVWGASGEFLVRLAPDGERRLIRPASNGTVYSICAANHFEVTVGYRELTRDGYVLAIHYSRDSGETWSKIGLLSLRPMAFDFLGKYLGVVACWSDGPPARTRLFYTRDGCKSWKSRELPGDEVHGIKIVNANEIHLLVRSFTTLRLSYVKWTPTW